ncbi:2-hydroxy-3-oxopropionate reductase [Pluralibacter gergoviae]|uniref:NAD(P)-dependent oxidoreductase n=1 Tax=Pluralibacter gergoviae TaxID=61647 RepID=UPI0009080FB0|nr:NAD(P)-dependent oxidoreductase [Pluralibacter gergoviae]OUQ94421.1 2-hydroxy-3-oxopropionate reductase [Pluralibacter gergoviae]
MKSIHTVGFIGLGMMGTPMAICLSRAGYSLLLHDADRQRADVLAESLRAAPLSTDNVASLDVLITMLPNSDIVEEVLFGQQWAKRLPAGAVVIDMSSSVPSRSRDLAQRLQQQDLCYLDAPVSGGVGRAEQGNLAILVGGEEKVLSRCQTLLAAMGSSILHIGAAGSGHAAKALNNYVSAAGLTATVEALLVARRFGIEPQVMTDVLNASSGRSNTSENKVRQFMLSGSYASGFALKLMDKDLQIAKGLAAAVDYPLRLGEHCIALWHQYAGTVSAGADHTEMYRLLDDNDPSTGN